MSVKRSKNSDDFVEALRSVARSFSLSLNILPARIRSCIRLGYLFCRAADSLADTPLLSQPDRKPALEKFRRLFVSYPLDTAGFQEFLHAYEKDFASKTSPEAVLFQMLPSGLNGYETLDATEKALVHEVVLGVTRGMEMDLETFGAASDSPAAFPKSETLEAYLGWIGGEPGRFWTKATLHHFPRLIKSNADRWIEDAVQFGKGLQMVNILRDIPADLKNGRCYIPLDLLNQFELTVADLLKPEGRSKCITLFHRLIDQTIGRLEFGLRYVRSLPRTAVRLRSAVWWPLSIGLRTLEKLRINENPFEARNPVKISRKEIYWTIGSSTFLLPFNGLLRWDYEDLAGRASSSLDGGLVKARLFD